MAKLEFPLNPGSRGLGSVTAMGVALMKRLNEQQSSNCRYECLTILTYLKQLGVLGVLQILVSFGDVVSYFHSYS